MDKEAEYLFLDDEILRLQNRKRQIDLAMKKVELQMDELKKQMVQEFLEDGVVPTKLTLKKIPPKPIITDESLIPDKYKKTKIEIDKAAINKAVKEGSVIGGVVLDNGGYTIAIKAQKESK